MADLELLKNGFVPGEERESAWVSTADTLLWSHERDSNIEFATEADNAAILNLAEEARREIRTQPRSHGRRGAIGNVCVSRGDHVGRSGHQRCFPYWLDRLCCGPDFISNSCHRGQKGTSR